MLVPNENHEIYADSFHSLQLRGNSDNIRGIFNQMR